jgi:hypothetical protein
MSSAALEALAAAEAAGVKITLDGDGLILETAPKLPPDIVEMLKTVKPDLLRVVAGREAARAAFDAVPPPDCSGRRWALAQRGLQHFVKKGWADQAALLGWSVDANFLHPPARNFLLAAIRCRWADCHS